MDLKDLLKLGAVIRLPYKENFEDWYGEVKFWKIRDSERYFIQVKDEEIDIIESFDEFFEKFSFYLNNIGILLREVLKENPDLEPEYSEEDLEKLKRLVEEKKRELEKKQ